MAQQKPPFQFFQPPNVQSGSRAASDTIPFNITLSFQLLRYITSQKHHIPLSLPHTVTYRAHEAPSWFFTSQKKQHCILRKNNANVTMESIYEQFKKSLLTKTKRMYQMSHEQARNNMKEMKEAKMESKQRERQASSKSNFYGASSSSSSAAHLLFTEDNDPKIRGVLVAQRGLAQERLKAEMSFLNKAKLKKFLFDKRKKRISNGFLQQFVPPSGNYNTHIKVTWTPSMCLIEHKRNRYRMDDESVDLHKRYSILNNDESWAMAETLDSSIQAQIERLNTGIVQQIFHITNQVHSVRKMVLTLKVDALGKLWFLFFDSLRTSTEDYPEPAKWINYILYNVNGDDDESETNDSDAPKKDSRNLAVANFQTAGAEDLTLSTLMRSRQSHERRKKPSTAPAGSKRSTRSHTIATRAKQQNDGSKPRGTSKSNQVAEALHLLQAPAPSRSGATALSDCPSCGSRFDRQSGIDVSYKILTQHHEMHHSESATEEKAKGTKSKVSDGNRKSSISQDTPVQQPDGFAESMMSGGLSPIRSNEDDQVFDDALLHRAAAAGNTGSTAGEVASKASEHQQEEIISSPRLASGVPTIPSVLQKVEPALGPLRYKKLRYNPIWSSKLVKLCASCASNYLADVIKQDEVSSNSGKTNKPSKISTARLQELSRPDSSKATKKKDSSACKSKMSSGSPISEKYKQHVVKSSQVAQRSLSPYSVHDLRGKTQESILQNILKKQPKSSESHYSAAGPPPPFRPDLMRKTGEIGSPSSNGIDSSRKKASSSVQNTKGSLRHSSRKTSARGEGRRSVQIQSSPRSIHRRGSSLRPKSTPSGAKRKVGAPPRNSAARRSFTRALEHYGSGGPPSKPSSVLQRPFIPSLNSPARNSPRMRSSTSSNDGHKEVSRSSFSGNGKILKTSSDVNTGSQSIGVDPLIKNAAPSSPSGKVPAKLLKELQLERQNLLDSLHLNQDLTSLDLESARRKNDGVTGEETEDKAPQSQQEDIHQKESTESDGSIERRNIAAPETVAPTATNTIAELDEVSHQMSPISSPKNLNQETADSSANKNLQSAKKGDRSVTPGFSDASFDEHIFDDEDFIDEVKL